MDIAEIEFDLPEVYAQHKTLIIVTRLNSNRGTDAGEYGHHHTHLICTLDCCHKGVCVGTQ